MPIVSFYFFIFVAVSLLIYYICPLKIRMYVPLIASIVFFIWGCGPVLFAVMCGMAMIAWFGALSVGKDAGRHKWIAGAAIALLAVVLIVFKENSFFTTNANIIGKLFKLNVHLSPPAWAAPLGVSYYTLMLISYLADVSWGKISAEKNPLKVLLFTCYFPQMTLGPFSRFNEMRENNMFTGNKFDYDNFCFGLQRMLWGLFKKLVLAERLSIIVKTIYDGAAAGTHDGVYIIIGAIAYVLQLYTDFSGAIDIIIGVSQMFGIRLPENFRQPFFSRSLSEIWRRWHMTLGFWLKDYVMYPVQKGLTSKFGRKAQKLFGKRLGKNLLLYLSLLITWFCVGFWHGGSWKYICSSGLFFFVMIVSGMILQPLFDKLKKLLRINTDAWSWHLFESFRSFSLFFFVMIVSGMILQPLFDKLKKLLRINTDAWSWHLFESFRSFSLFALSVSFGRAASLTEGFKFWKLAFNYNPWVLFDGSLLKLGLDVKDLSVLISGLLIMLIVSTMQLKGGIRQRLASQNLPLRWVVYLCMFFAVIIFGMYGEGYNPADFIYGGF